MTNSSSSGGYLTPASTPAPLEGQALLRFLQQVIVGISTLDGTLVRPSWQADPANIPTASVCWCAFGINSRSADTFAYVDYTNIDTTGAQMQRHETLEVLCSFYDQGSGAEADYYAALLRDGLQISQNRDILLGNNFGLIETTELMAVPLLTKDRWMYRVDFRMRLRRQIDRDYAVQSIQGVEDLIIHNDVGLPDQEITVLPDDVWATEDGLGGWVVEDGTGYWLWG